MRNNAQYQTGLSGNCCVKKRVSLLSCRWDREWLNDMSIKIVKKMRVLNNSEKKKSESEFMIEKGYEN